MLDMQALARGVVASLVYSLIGVVVLGLAFAIINKMLPFSLRKEIEEDQNVALGIVLGAIIIGLALIISAAVHG